MPWERASSSEFTAIRKAWKERLQGFFSRLAAAGMELLMISASSMVRSMGTCSRRLTMFRAICQANFSSPYSRKIRASSAAGASLTKSLALTPSWDIRISKGASFW